MWYSLLTIRLPESTLSTLLIPAAIAGSAAAAATMLLGLHAFHSTLCALPTVVLCLRVLSHFCLQELIPELSAAVEKVGFTWKDFTVTDNSCKPHPPQKSLVQVCGCWATRPT
jgi:hypothetical protein